MRWIAILVLVPAAALAAPPTRPAPTAATGEFATLSERLKVGLRVKAPADSAFCDRVVELVRTGRLPAEVVDSTYLWSVRRGREYPFPAFERAIRLKAARIGTPL